MKLKNDSVCCARCTKPIVGERHKVGRFTYGDCCILKVLNEQEKKTNAQKTR